MSSIYIGKYNIMKNVILLSFLYITLIRVGYSNSFSKIVIFGDSLSDSGQYFDPIAATVGDFTGLRFTNRVDAANPVSRTSQVWSQYFSLSLGSGESLPSTPYLGVLAAPPGDNYAVAAYLTSEILASIKDPNGNALQDPDLFFGPGADIFGKDVVSRDGYLVENPLADGNALYVVWGGGNDIRDIRNARFAGGDQATLVANSQAAADNLVDGVKALIAAGARHILVPNLPDFGKPPESSFLGSVAEGTEATTEFNARLAAGLNTVGINVMHVDVDRLFNEIIANPVSFGFSNEDHSVVAFDGAAFSLIPAAEGVNGASSGTPDPSQYVFFDGVHPTTYTHEIVSDFYQSIFMFIVPSFVSIIPEISLTMGRSHQRTVGNHLHRVRNVSTEGQIIPFVNGNITWGDGDDTRSTPDYDSDQSGLAIGASYRINENWLTGMALEFSNSETDIDNNIGDFEVDGDFLSLFTGYQNESLFVNATATFGNLEYDIDRIVQLGRLTRKHSGDADGDYLALMVSAGIDIFDHNGLTLSPIATLNYQEVEVDDFSEKPSLSTSVSYSNLDRESLILSAGIEARYLTKSPLGLLQFHGNISIEKDFENDPTNIRITRNSLLGRSDEIRGYNPDDTSVTLEAGVNAEIAKGLIASIGYRFRTNDDIRDQSINLGLQLAF